MVNRRQVLVGMGGIATVGLAGKVAAGGNGAGGMGFITDVGLSRLGEVGQVFEIQHLEPEIWLRGAQAACNAGAERDFVAYRIATPDGANAGLFVNPNRNLNTGVDAVFSAVSEDCGEAVLEHGPLGFSETRTISRVEFESSRSNNGRDPHRGNWLVDVAEPVELKEGDVEIGSNFYVVRHDIPSRFGEYSMLVQREPNRIGGENHVVEDPVQFDAAWLGITEDGEPVKHKGTFQWYYDTANYGWVSLEFVFDGRGNLLSVNGVEPK